MNRNRVPYARHYNPRFVLFLPHFSFSLRFILQTIYVLKTKNLHFLSLKSGLYMRAVSDQERVIMARVRRTVHILFLVTHTHTFFCHFKAKFRVETAEIWEKENGIFVRSLVLKTNDVNVQLCCFENMDADDMTL